MRVALKAWGLLLPDGALAVSMEGEHVHMVLTQSEGAMQEFIKTATLLAKLGGESQGDLEELGASKPVAVTVSWERA